MGSAAWNGLGGLDEPNPGPLARWSARNRWRSVPLAIQVTDTDVLVVHCDLPLVGALMRPRNYPLIGVASIQEASTGPSAGFRLVLRTGAVVYVWTRLAPDVVAEVGRRGVPRIGGVWQKLRWADASGDYRA